MLNQKFDFVVSIGEDCACAMYLNRFRLRARSYPFDWLCNASFETRINLILNNFHGFLVRENMRWFPKPTSGLRDTQNENYEDTATGFYFYHDFTSNVDFDVIFLYVHEKYMRRIARFYDAIKNSRTVLFVWWSRDKIIPLQNIIDAQRQLSEKFNKQINMLIFEHAPDSELQVDNVTEHIVIARGHLTVPENTTVGNEKLCNQVFKKIRRTNTWKIRVIKIVCGMIPYRPWRKNLRAHAIAHCQKY